MQMELLNLRCDANTELRTLFVKEHQTENSASKSTAIFVAGLPVPLADESKLQTLFGVYGEIHAIALHPSKKSCVVVFSDSKSKDQVLSAARHHQVLEWKGGLPSTGLEDWLKEHKNGFPGDDALQKKVDNWIIAFERAEKERNKASKKNVFEDGWVVVKRKKRKGIHLEGNAAPDEDSSKQTKKMKDYSDLYRISQREHRMEAALTLQQRFEEDKKRVAAHRAKREFTC